MPLQLVQLRLRAARSPCAPRARCPHGPSRRCGDDALPGRRRRNRCAHGVGERPTRERDDRDLECDDRDVSVDRHRARRAARDLQRRRSVDLPLRREGRVRAEPPDPPDLFELVRQPEEGCADLSLARGPPRLGPVRVHVRREHADTLRADPASAADGVERACRRASAPRHLHHGDGARRVLQRARRSALVRPAGGLPRQRRQPRGREGGRLRLPRA